MTEYLFFSLGFFAIHLVCYVAAGVIDLQLARHMYGGKNRLFGSFMRDTDDAGESKRIAALLLPSQFVRAVLMSLVLYPILPFLTDLSFAVQFLFMSSLMLIYADVASAVPFSNTIEGLVYMKKEFVRPRVFLTIQLEALLYSSLFGLLAAWLLV
ncbi:hypothetical protein GVX82_00390 [Patescibacteria group bacterium]|jgi:hypothetical protein|nr:hypothetical protein [Patescibacteria group bacterium]